MPRLPVVSGKELVRFFEKNGFQKKRQRGSHIAMAKEGIHRPLIIPDYKELSETIILNNLRTAGISRKEFISAFKKN